MGTGKKKIEIKKMEKAEQRMVTFSKRRQTLFKKSHDLHCLTGANIAVVAFSPAGRPYTHSSGTSFDATIDKYLNNGQESYNTNGGSDEYCKAKQMRSWLEGIQVEAYESVDDLVFVKEWVEEIMDKVLFRLTQNTDQGFLESLLGGLI